MIRPYILRPRVEQILSALARAPIVAVLGPRQCGKTTLAKQIAAGGGTIFDLERSSDRQALAAAPERVLGSQRGLIVLDEVQTMPELFPLLRVLADRDPLPARFLILGSASPDLVRGASEALAGRVELIHMSGLDLTDLGAGASRTLWIRGGLPRSFLTIDDASSYAWRQDFIDTFPTRDIARFGASMPPEELRRLMTMLAHLHGGTLNMSELGRAMSLHHKTAGRYVEVLAGMFMVRLLPPWVENVGKRLVRSPKIYVRDTGLLHALLGLRDERDVLAHPRYAASWEGFALEQIIARLGAERDAYFWRTHAGAELDLFVVRGGRRYGFDVKFDDWPRTTRSMRIAMEDLRLERLFVVYPGSRSYGLDEGIELLALADLARRLPGL